MNPVILGHENDNVVTCCTQFEPKTEVAVLGEVIRVIDQIPIYHKMARFNIEPGSKVYKYGEPIGTASKFIAAGSHVHTHNLESGRGRGDLKG